jgi:hypothetical protein
MISASLTWSASNVDPHDAELRAILAFRTW